VLRSFCDCPGCAVDVHHLPDCDAMAEHMRLASTGGVTKADAGEFLLQCLFLEVKTAQRGDLQMASPGLSRQQRGMAFVDATGLNDGWHAPRVVYNVNTVKQRLVSGQRDLLDAA